ncbi:unnamed protein product [Alopecurus aequalis]
MPLYRDIYRVKVGDGRHASFWMDSWTGATSLRLRFPVLFSHARDADVTVATVVSGGLRGSLVPRLNSAGALQLPLAEALLPELHELEGHDTWALTRCVRRSGALNAASLYQLCSLGGVEVPFAAFIWKNFAPSRVRFFGLMLLQSRIQSRGSLLRKKIIPEDEAHCPICDDPVETSDHLMLNCVFARRFWAIVGWTLTPDAFVYNIHEYGAPPGIPARTESTFLLLCCWNLWKHRNAVTFREQRPCLALLLRACRDDVHLWRTRLPPELEHSTDSWLSCLDAGRRANPLM